MADEHKGPLEAYACPKLRAENTNTKCRMGTTLTITPRQPYDEESLLIRLKRRRLSFSVELTVIVVTSCLPYKNDNDIWIRYTETFDAISNTNGARKRWYLPTISGYGYWR